MRSGAPGVHVQLGEISDERFDRLADTFNQMLAQLEHDSQEMQQLSRLILQAQEDERYRLARELHDEAAQALTSLLVHLRLLERARDPESAQQQVKELRVLTASALENVRRVALDLRPTILDDLGLASALEWRVDEFNKMEGMNAKISITGLDHRLPRDLELVLYRIGQEALSNVGRHAHATHVELRLDRIPGQVMLEVRDDGAGFDPMTIGGSDRGLGLLGMRERIGMVDGELLVESQVGKGTRIIVTAPAP
ncbi:MAG: sensor histidine kinase [Anaerolineales bacterium]|nr:sensor histidine kinase [Anaerolineales bacterium]